MILPACLPREMDERPPGFIPLNLSPVGLRLQPRELATGVWALMADQPPKDNNGLIVGEHSALVVDAGVTPAVGRQIQALAAELTDVPVRYLVNTTYAPFLDLIRSLHHLNVLLTYRWVQATAG